MRKAGSARYNIGAVSRLTGVSREKIRIWERRYGAVQPERDEANLRKYSQQDVERLLLLRRLVDSGQAISNIANLSLAALQARLDQQRPIAEPGAPLPGSALAVLREGNGLQRTLTGLGIQSVAAVADLAEAERWLADNQADLIVAEFPTLLSANLNAIRRLHSLAPRSRLLVVYRFAPSPVLAQMQAVGIRAIKAPLQGDDLRSAPQAAATANAAEPRQDYRKRQYSPEQLARLSGLAHRLQCECPRHLADLVRDLDAFEDYSLGCETESAADAAMHREVYDIVARARALVEDALGIVAAEENLTT